MSTGIGARVQRKEDHRLLHGQAKFVGDLKFPKLWEAAYVRSPIAHGRIRSVQKPSAYSSQVFIADDLHDVLPIRAESSLPSYKPSDFHPLARDKVRYVGECIAICIAPTRAEAEDIAEQVILDIDPLPAVIDALKAREPQSELLHEDWGDNLFVETSFEGDIETAKRDATVVIEREYKTARQCMNPMEGKGTLSYWDERSNQLVVYTSTQVPHLIRTGISCKWIKARSEL